MTHPGGFVVDPAQRQELRDEEVPIYRASRARVTQSADT
jgi:hypothetical protein